MMILDIIINWVKFRSKDSLIDFSYCADVISKLISLDMTLVFNH